MTDDKNIKQKSKKFIQRLDFYWQSISAYAIVLIVYAFLRGTIEKGTISVTWMDPIVVLMLVFIVATSVALLINYSKNRKIIVGDDFITFKSRIGEKTYTLDDILRISMSREKIGNINNKYRIIKIKVNKRRRLIRIRPSAFWNEKQMIDYLANLRRQVIARKNSKA